MDIGLELNLHSHLTNADDRVELVPYCIYFLVTPSFLYQHGAFRKPIGCSAAAQVVIMWDGDAGQGKPLL